MDIVIKLLLVLHVVVCLLLALLVLMQRPKNEGLGAAFGSGMTDSVWGAQTTDILQKGTKVFGTLFFLITLVLAVLQSTKHSGPTVEQDGDNVLAPAVITAPAELEDTELIAPAEVEDTTTPADEAPAEETPAAPAEDPSAPAEEPSAPAETPAAPQQ